jgi:site-specific recombinase XerD
MTPLRQQLLDALELHGFAQRTREAYLHWAIELARATHTSPDQLEGPDIERFLLHLLRERHLAPATCNQALHALRFLWCEVLKRPQVLVDLPSAKVPQRLPEILSREEVARILDATPNLRNRAALTTTYAAGLRVSELAHLRVSDIDSQRMALRVEQGKGGRDRYTLLPAPLLETLRFYWLAYRPHTWLFPQRHADRPIDGRQAEKWFYDARDKAGITKKVGIHALRHAFATHLLEAGVDIHTIQELMGHASLTSTQRYLHLARPEALSTSARLNLLAALPA